MIISKCSVL